jgi:hypothetical protein
VEDRVAQERGRRDPDLGAAYAGIAVGALAVVGATAVALRWAARPPVRTLVVGRGRLVYRGGARGRWASGRLRR